MATLGTSKDRAPGREFGGVGRREEESGGGGALCRGREGCGEDSGARGVGHGLCGGTWAEGRGGWGEWGVEVVVRVFFWMRRGEWEWELEGGNVIWDRKSRGEGRRESQERTHVHRENKGERDTQRARETVREKKIGMLKDPAQNRLTPASSEDTSSSSIDNRMPLYSIYTFTTSQRQVLRCALVE